MQIRIIAAVDEDRGIGKDNKLPWSNRKDMQHFSRITTGNGKNAVLMGKNTFTSIGKKLPNRINIILSKSINPETIPKDINIVRSIDSGIDLAKSKSLETLWIIGGESIYKLVIDQYRNLIDDCVLSIIPGKHDCDAFFPILDSHWHNEETQGSLSNDDELKINYYKNNLKG